MRNADTQTYPAVSVRGNPFFKYIFSIKGPKLVLCVFKAYCRTVVRQFPVSHHPPDVSKLPKNSLYHPIFKISKRKSAKAAGSRIYCKVDFTYQVIWLCLLLLVALGHVKNLHQDNSKPIIIQQCSQIDALQTGKQSFFCLTI